MSGPIKKLPGPIYDSLGRCDTPSMLYDTIRNPNSTYTAPAQKIDSAESIESTQKRLNRETLERLKNFGLSLPHESFVAVVQIGKYMFLAIMLPPYLCFYGIPRWMMTNIMPQMLGFMKQEMLRVGRFVFELAKRIPDIMKGVLEQLIGDALRITKQQIKSFATHIFEAGKSITKFITDPFKRLMSQIKDSRDNFVGMSGQFFLKLPQTIDRIKERIQKKIVESLRKCANAALKVLHLVDQTVFTPAINWIALPFIKTAQLSKAMGRLIAKQVARVRKRIEKAFEPVVNTVKTIFTAVAKITNYIVQNTIQPVISFIQTRTQAAFSLMQKAGSKATKPFVKLTKGAKVLIDKGASAVNYVIKNIVMPLPQIMVQAVVWCWGLIPADRRDGFQRYRNGAARFGRFVKKCAKGLIPAVKKGMQSTYRKTFNFLRWLVSAVVRLCLFLKDQLIELPKKIARGVVRLWRGVRLIVKGMVHGFRLSIAWTRAIIAIAFLTVHNFLETDEGLE